MCKANGKRWSDYRESDRCQEYLDALEAETGISVFDLIRSRRGGTSTGTWVHPQVAVDLARWISAPFAVWMDKWFLESAQGSSVPAPVPVQAPTLAPTATLDLIDRSFSMLERFGVVDDRDRLQFGDMVRNVAARGAGGLILPPSAEEEEMTLSDAWLEVIGKPMPRNQGSNVGRILAEMFRKEFQKEPPSRTQYVDGAPRKVKSYKRGWILKALEAIKDDIARKSLR